MNTTNLAKLNAKNTFTSEGNTFQYNILLQGRSDIANIVAYKDVDEFAIRFGSNTLTIKSDGLYFNNTKIAG